MLEPKVDKTAEAGAVIAGATTGALYYWDPVRKRYVSSSGRLVGYKRVKGVAKELLKDAKEAILEDAKLVANGRIKVKLWQVRHARHVKNMQLSQMALARGGWAHITPADLKLMERILRFQMSRVEAFAADIASGKLRTTAGILQRAGYYEESARHTFWHFVRQNASELKMDRERNITMPGETCKGCAEAEDKGWVPLGTLVPIGSRDCGPRCRCVLQFMNTSTGETYY